MLDGDTDTGTLDTGETPPETGDQDTGQGTSSGSGETPPEGKPKTVPVSELAAERRRRKQLEARLTELEEAEKQRADAQKSEAEKALDRANRAEAAAAAAQRDLQVERLGAAVRKAAKAAGFRDEDDAVMAVDASAIEWDDGKPDKKSVEAAVKAVAQAKPHWLLAEGERSTGSKFGGPGKRTQEPDEEMLARLFPALGPSTTRNTRPS